MQDNFNIKNNVSLKMYISEATDSNSFKLSKSDLTSLKIAKMTLSDLNSISEILESDFDDFWNYNILKNELQNSNSFYLVCKLNDEIVSFAGITIILDTVELNNIVVKKIYRGNGISSIILNELINICRSNNCIHFNLEVASTNIPAINLYEKFNFKLVGCRKGYYKGVDALLYTLNF